MSSTSLRVYDHEIEQLIESGRTDEAIAHCRHILQSFPKHLETHRLLGKAYLESRRYAEAVDILERVLLSVPNDFVSHVGLSIAADERGDLDAAIRHMQRAFESQPANQAIQGELQRLFGRRDGVEPPKIRMTRGALAQMYVQGELFPQAISEIRAVLSQDAQRPDLQVLLAHAYFRAGQVADATELCRRLLADRPYCLEANRIMAELAPPSAGDPAADVLRRRVIELDPYAAHSPDSLARADQVNDAAVQVQRLDYTGQSPDSSIPWASALGGIEAPISGPGIHVAEAAAARAPEFPAPSSWMQAPSGLVAADAAVSPSLDGSDELTPAQLPDWLKEKMPVDEPAWLGGIGAGSAPPAALADAPFVSRAADEAPPNASRPSGPIPSPDEDVPSWLKDLGQGETEAHAGTTGQGKSATVPIDWQAGEVGESFDGAAFEDALRASPDGADSPLGWFTALTDGDGAIPAQDSPAAPNWARPPHGPEGSPRRTEAEALSQLLPASDGIPPSDPTGWLRSLQPEAADVREGSLPAEAEGQPSIPDGDGPAWLRTSDARFPQSTADSSPTPVGDWRSAVVSDGGQSTELSSEPAQPPDSALLDTDGLPAWLGGPSPREETSNNQAQVGAADPISSETHAQPESAPASASDVGQPPVPETHDTDIPVWLRGFDEPGSADHPSGSIEAPPDWLDAEAHQPIAEPTAPSDWRPLGDLLSRIGSVDSSLPDPATTLDSRDAGHTAGDEAALATARGGLHRGELPVALETYEGLIRRGVQLEETLRDLRDATHRYPLDVHVWQTLGDAYMRLNRLREALDAYNKAEEMLR